MKKKNAFSILLVTAGVILFGVIAFVVINSTRTIQAVVPNQEIPSGTRVEAEMLSVIEVPVGTPTGFITDRSSLVGQKLKTTVYPNQLLYVSNVITGWDDVVYGVDVPDDYIITAIQLPANRAVGGLITVGDTVDILGVPNSELRSQFINQTNQTVVGNTMGVPGQINDGDGSLGTLTTVDGQEESTAMQIARTHLGAIADTAYGADGVQLFWVLANVKILETDSTLSSAENSVVSVITGSDSGAANNGDYYIVALSYSDYLRMMLASQYLDFYMNISPAWNNDHDPLIDYMNNLEIKELMDAQAQTILREVVKDGSDAVTEPEVDLSSEEGDQSDLSNENESVQSEILDEESKTDQSQGIEYEQNGPNDAENGMQTDGNNE